MEGLTDAATAIELGFSVIGRPACLGCEDMITAVVRKSGPGTTLVVEGPTDAAAAIDLGFNVIGRPACLGCEDMIVELVRKCGPGTTLIIADADGPGQRGAK